MAFQSISFFRFQGSSQLPFAAFIANERRLIGWGTKTLVDLWLVLLLPLEARR